MPVMDLREVTFSEKLKELFDLSGMKAQALANATGIKLPTIRAYMRGVREPSFSNAAKIAKAFGKTLEYFEDADEVTGTRKKKGK